MKILDCTLRDGGFRCNFNWNFNFAVRYYDLMSKFNIPYIELGYWKQTAKSKNPFYNLNFKTLNYITQNIKKPNAVVIIDYHYCSKNLDDYPKKFQTNICMIRLTARKEDFKKALIFAGKLSKKTGLDISFQLINVTNYSQKEILKAIQILVERDLFCVYFADSHGNLNLFENYYKFEESIELLKKNNIKIGFHLHNHTSRALLNYYICKKNNIDMIDSSILGLGKGGGNLKLEDIINNENLIELLEFIKVERNFLLSKIEDKYFYNLITGRLNVTDNYASVAFLKKMELKHFYNKCLLMRGINKDTFNKNNLI